MIQSKRATRTTGFYLSRTMTVLAVVALTGCTFAGSGFSGRPNYSAATPTGIEGSWRSTENLYNASFINNTTQWNEIDTGALLITGTYVQTTATDYTLQLTSQVTGQTRSANCRLVNVSSMNCTRDDGNQFSMVRGFGAAQPTSGVVQSTSAGATIGATGGF